MRRAVGFVLSFIAITAVGASAQDAARGPAVGDDAPPVLATAWLNTDGGGSPLVAGRAEDGILMLEFWGTWCGPCVRAMPQVQALHERFHDKGVTVVAITYEGADVAKPFLEENGYTMVVACDTSQDSIRSYGVSSWPATVVIDAEGAIAYIGGPAGAEHAIEKALGLESDASALLTAYVDALQGDDDDVRRAGLERLVAKAPTSFDLSKWAAGQGGATAEKVVKLDAGGELDRCATASQKKSDAGRQKSLDQLVASHTSAFDLRAWARARFADEYPLKKKELEALLDAKSFGIALDALIDRNPSSAVVKAASKHEGLVRHCRTKAAETYKLARKGVMCVDYVFEPGAIRQEDNEAFWAELSVSGLMTDKEKKRCTGVAIGGAMIVEAEMSAFVDRNLARFMVMDAIGNGRKLKLGNVPKSAAKERGRIAKALKSKYG